MMLSSTPAGIQWLRQFDAREVHVARLMLDLLKLVSFSEFEAAIVRMVGEICDATSGRIAIFSVAEGGEDRRPGSSGRIDHLLTRLSSSRGVRTR